MHQLCTEVVGFIMHHSVVAVPTEASTLWFLVINCSVQLACSLAMRMPVPTSVVHGLPTEQEWWQTLVPKLVTICGSLMG